MGVTRTIGRQLAPRVVPRVTQLAPGLSASFVREALHRALAGAGPFTSAAALADKLLHSNDGDVDAAVKDVVDHHIRYAGVQGFATNLGGLVTMTVAVPANITGLAVLQDRMVAGVAHLRGYDLDGPGEATAADAIRSAALSLKAGALPGVGTPIHETLQALARAGWKPGPWAEAIGADRATVEPGGA